MHETRVSDVMTHLVVTLRPSDTIHEAAARLARNHISGAPVVEGNTVVGIITEDDIVREIARPAHVNGGVSAFDLLSLITRGTPFTKSTAPRVVDAMSVDVATVSAGTSVWKAAEIMQRRTVKRLPVLDEAGSLVGIVSRADLVRFMGRDDHEIAQEIVTAVKVLGEDEIPDLDVEVRDGIATLTGTADRASTRKIAGRIAARVPGVVKVRDRMQHEWDDSHITGPPPRRANVPADAWSAGVVGKI